jgi:ABC-type transport system involved in cytochrome c biogenesis permease subunit
VLINKNFHVFISSFVLVAFELIAISVYAVYSQDRLWMPRPEFNWLSYSYWIEFAALVLALGACKFELINKFRLKRWIICC